MLASLEHHKSPSRLTAQFAFAMGAGLLAGCHGRAPTRPVPAHPRTPATSEAAYHPSPMATAVGRTADGRPVVEGQAQPGDRVRLATPDANAITVSASGSGAWRIILPSSSAMRLFGLSMVDAGRTVQAEGYLAVAPDVSARLNAGAGAISLIGLSDKPRLTAIDLDRKGGCVVSGVDAPARVVTVSIDGMRRGAARVAGDGRVAVELDQPIGFGAHRLELSDGQAVARLDVDIAPPESPGSAPFRATPIADGWRIDWVTPGGGAQSTLLFKARTI